MEEYFSEDVDENVKVLLQAGLHKELNFNKEESEYFDFTWWFQFPLHQ